MTTQEIRAKIIEWITTGIPRNVKSFNLRTLLSNILVRMDLLEPGRLKITKAIGNGGLSLEIGDTVYGIIENILVKEGIYLGGDQSLLSSYYILDNNGTGNASDYFEYTNIPDMLANQSEQNSGDLCFVADATDDDDIDYGDATYIFLGIENGLLSDYRRLSDAELTTLNPTPPPNEEQVIGTAIYLTEADANVSDEIVINLATFASSRIHIDSLDVTLVDTAGRPALGESFTKYYTLTTENGTEAFTEPLDWIMMGEDLDATKTNCIAVEYSNFPTVGLNIRAYNTYEP